MSIPGPMIFVDDDEDDHDLLKVICKRLGVCEEIKFFHNGYDMLYYLRTTRDSPFIIMCDINMPHINGLELKKIINEDEVLRGKSIPFIFFSTAATGSQVLEAYQLMAQGFFLKGQNFDEIENTLRVVMDYWLKCKYPNSIGRDASLGGFPL